MIYKGKIKGFSGSWGSGIGFLLIEDSDTQETGAVPCENARTVRGLQACFGNVIGGAHDVKRDAGFLNQEIYWAYDDMGLILAGFTPVEEASPELEEAYRKAKKERG